MTDLSDRWVEPGPTRIFAGLDSGWSSDRRGVDNPVAAGRTCSRVARAVADHDALARGTVACVGRCPRGTASRGLPPPGEAQGDFPTSRQTGRAFAQRLVAK